MKTIKLSKWIDGLARENVKFRLVLNILNVHADISR